MQQGKVVYFGLNGKPAVDYFYDHFEQVSLSRLLVPLKVGLTMCDEQAMEG